MLSIVCFFGCLSLFCVWKIYTLTKACKKDRADAPLIKGTSTEGKLDAIEVKEQIVYRSLADPEGGH